MRRYLADLNFGYDLVRVQVQVRLHLKNHSVHVLPYTIGADLIPPRTFGSSSVYTFPIDAPILLGSRLAMARRGASSASRAVGPRSRTVKLGVIIFIALSVTYLNYSHYHFHSVTAQSKDGNKSSIPVAQHEVAVGSLKEGATTQPLIVPEQTLRKPQQPAEMLNAAATIPTPPAPEKVSTGVSVQLPASGDALRGKGTFWSPEAALEMPTGQHTRPEPQGRCSPTQNVPLGPGRPLNRLPNVYKTDIASCEGHGLGVSACFGPACLHSVIRGIRVKVALAWC